MPKKVYILILSTDFVRYLYVVYEGVRLSDPSDQMTSHKRGICEASPLCEETLCSFKQFFKAYDFPHTSQENGFSPVCVRTCWSMLPFWANRLPHSEHAKGFSPLWALMWRWSFDAVGNCLLHWTHWFFFCVDEGWVLLSPGVIFPSPSVATS